MKFRKKPVVIEAVQLKLEMPRDEMPDWLTYAADNGTIELYTLELEGGDEAEATIYTLEGEMVAAQGDWIIQGIKGELYPCKPDIFEATYEPVEESHD